MSAAITCSRCAAAPSAASRKCARAPSARGFDAFEKCWDKGVFERPVGDALAFCPPLIAQKKHLDQMFGTVAEVLKTLG